MVYMHCPIFEVLLKIHSIFFILCETFCIQIICRVGSLTDMRRASLVLGVWRGRKVKRVLSSGFEWWLRSKMIVRPGYTASSYHSLWCIQHPQPRFSLFQKRKISLGRKIGNPPFKQWHTYSSVEHSWFISLITIGIQLAQLCVMRLWSPIYWKIGDLVRFDHWLTDKVK